MITSRVGVAAYSGDAANVGSTPSRGEKLHRSCALPGEQRGLARHSPAIAAERSVAAYHAMTGNEHGDPIARAGARHCACGGGMTELARDLLIAPRRPFRDALESAPHLPLECRRLEVERKLPRACGPLDVRDDRVDEAIVRVGCTRELGGRILRAQRVDECILLVTERDAADASLGHGDEQQAE